MQKNCFAHVKTNNMFVMNRKERFKAQGNKKKWRGSIRKKRKSLPLRDNIKYTKNLQHKLKKKWEYNLARKANLRLQNG